MCCWRSQWRESKASLAYCRFVMTDTHERGRFLLQLSPGSPQTCYCPLRGQLNVIPVEICACACPARKLS